MDGERETPAERSAIEALKTARGLLLAITDDGARRGDTRAWLALRAVERAIEALESSE